MALPAFKARIPIIKGLLVLNCSNCPLLTNIPLIEKLQKLYCEYCPLLTNILSYTTLQELNCSSCPLLKNIPLIESLKILYCFNCPMLTKIAIIKDEKVLTSGRIFQEKTSKSKLRELYCTKCKWLNINNIEYDNNIKNLIKLQMWLKKILMSKRLICLIPKLMPIYYHPEAKGGYLHKKNMLKFVINI